VPVTIELLSASDWPEVSDIYADGIADGNSTFETECPSWERWDQAHLEWGRRVARLDGKTVGWAALSPVSHRPCYAGVAEVSVYVASAARRRGVGCALLRALVDESEQRGILTLQAATFAENDASLGLQQSCGFRVVGRRERIGQLHGMWRDTVLMERRSRVVG